MVILKYLSLFLFLGYLVQANGAEVFLNSTAAASCTLNSTLCYFQDPTLWDNNIAPNTSDTVNINILTQIYLFYNESITLAALDVQGVITIILNTNASISAENLTLSGSGVVFVVKDWSRVVIEENTWLLDGAKLDLNDNSGFAQAGTQFFMDRQSVVFVSDGAYIGLHSADAYIQGQFVFSSPNAIFISTGNLHFLNLQEAIFTNTPIIFTAYFDSSTVIFQQGWNKGNLAFLRSSNVTIYGDANPLVLNNITIDQSSILYLRSIPDCTLNTPNVTGTLYISTSNVHIYQTRSFNSPLVLAGDADFTVDVLVLKTLSFATGELGEAPNVNVMTNILHVFADFVFPGEIYVYQYAYFAGSLNLTGGVSVSGEMRVESPVFIAGGAINIGFGPMLQDPIVPVYSALFLDGTYFSAPTLYIGDNATFASFDSVVTGNIQLFYNSTLFQHNTSFYANIYNDGNIDVHADRVLRLQGNYTQGSQGTLTVVDMDLAGRTGGYLSANGSVNLNGRIVYSIKTAAQNDNQMQLLAVAATQGVFGAFQDGPANVGLLQNKASLMYTTNDVYLVFGHTNSDKKLGWWVWLIIVFGFVSAVGLATLLYLTRHKRKGFNTVPSD